MIGRALQKVVVQRGEREREAKERMNAVVAAANTLMERRTNLSDAGSVRSRVPRRAPGRYGVAASERGFLSGGDNGGA